jgi:flagellar protein FlbD
MGRLFLSLPLHYTSYVIRLKRLNGTRFVLNCDLIKTIEATPDTLITLLSGEKLMVLDPVDEVVKSTMEYRKRLAQEPPGKGNAQGNE